MASLNKVMLIGYLGDEPKIERLQSGNVKATLSLATTEKGYTTRSGSVIPDKTEWHIVTFWGNLAEVCEKYLHKGMQIYADGKLKTSSWDDADGKKHYKTEVAGGSVQILDRKPTEVSGHQNASNALQVTGNGQTYAAQPEGQSSEAMRGSMMGEPNNNDDDLPF